MFDFTDKLLLYSIFLVHKSSIRLKIAVKSRTNVSIYQQIAKNNVFIKQMIPPIIETPTNWWKKNYFQNENYIYAILQFETNQ